MAKELKFAECITNIGEQSDDAELIIKNARNLALASMSRDYGYTGMVKKFNMDGTAYAKSNEEVKKAVLAFCGAQSHIKEITEKKHLVNAFDNAIFKTIWNSIITDTLLGVITNSNPSQIMGLANIHDVEVGDSFTEEIESKGLPVAQRNSYNSNVVFQDSYSTMPITITPKVYSVGTSIDYIRILGNNFDFGKEIAKVAMSLLYAQFKLVTGILFDSTNLTGTPLYQATFAGAKYVKLISWLQALNKTSVKAYGTLPAFQAQGTTATTNYGFQTQDEMIRNGYIGHAYGIDNYVIDQATDLSAPFIDEATADKLMLIPNNEILLISDVGDKPVKLVRENLVRVIANEPTKGSLYKQSYTYTMAFDAGLATQAHYAIQGV